MRNLCLCIMLLALVSGVAQAQKHESRVYRVTFHTHPEHSAIWVHDSARKPAYLGLTGDPLALDAERFLRGSSLEVVFKHAGYADWSETIPSGLFHDGASWPPAGGKVVRLEPTTTVVALNDFVSDHPLAVTGAAFLLLGLGANERRRRRTHRSALKVVESRERDAASALAFNETAGEGDQTAALLATIGYRMKRELGRGGMSRVYEVTSEANPDGVALKLLNPEISSDTESILRLQREIKIWRRLVHPGIVPLLDYGQLHQRHYLVMEKVDGLSLRDRLLQGRIPLEEGLRAVDFLLDTVGYAHRLGVVHRDLKPENIMLRSDGRLQILDFGISKNMNTATMVTMGDSVMGTPGYMAPERFSGRGDAVTDQYALGIIFYEILAGSHPLGDERDIALVIHKQLSLIPSSMLTLRPGIPEEVDAVVLRMLEKDPDKRFKDVEAARQALHWAVGSGVKVRGALSSP